MSSSARKLSHQELILLYRIYQQESTLFQLFPEVIRLIRAGEPCLTVLQRKFGFSSKDINRLQQIACPEIEFRNFLLRLQQQALITSEETQPPQTRENKNAIVSIGGVFVILLVCVSLWVMRETESPIDSDTPQTSSETPDTKETISPDLSFEKNLESLLTSGLTEKKAGNKEQAKKLFQDVLTQRPKHLKANFQMGQLLLAEKQYELAYPFFKQVIESDDSAPEDLVAKATASYLLNHLEWAEQFALKAISALPDHQELLTLLGHIQWALGKEKESIAFFEKAYQLGETDPQVLILLAETYWKQERLEQAMKPLQQLLLQHPEDPVALKILAQIEMAQGKSVEGVARLEKVTLQGPQNFSSLSLLVKGLRESGQWDKALSILEPYVTMHLQDSLAMNLYGEVLVEKGDTEKALEAFEKACEIQKENIRAQINRAILLEENKQFDKALSIYDLCLQIDPKSEIVHYNRAWILLQMEKFELAESAIESMEKQFPASSLTRLGLKNFAEHYYAKKDFEQAQVYFSRLIELQEDDEEALLRYGMSALKNKQYEDVRQSFEKLLRLNPEHPKKDLLEQVLNSLEKNK